jgi:deoxyribodipyrimidine photo-lyase
LIYSDTIRQHTFPVFPTGYSEILERIKQIDPVRYGKTRNYIDGAVTHLSPYISRGVISTRQVLESLLKRGYKLYEMEAFVKELAWRDYFQRVWQEIDINQDIKHPQENVRNYGIPSAVAEAATGITSLDEAIEQLYTSGYIHNHCRMYMAAVVCNVAQSHWYMPARWMYYHLLDGDWASNACSWQWVAGTNSNKKYVVNQENINRFTYSAQKNTFLDHPYEKLDHLPVPEHLKETIAFEEKTSLPLAENININPTLPTFIYNYYNLDPVWHANEEGNRILLIEPSLFDQYPISRKCMDFMLALSKNIPGIQLYVGSFGELATVFELKNIYYKEHPLNKHYSGTAESRDWLSEALSGYYPSFFAYWKKLEKHLR